jgi:phosphoribosylformylglycinamidine synthase
MYDRTEGRPPAPRLAEASALCALLAAAARDGLLRSAHDAADGGIAVALAESALAAGLGVDVTLATEGLRADVALFGEGRGAVVASATVADAAVLLGRAAAAGLAGTRVGAVTADGRVRIACGDGRIDVATADAAHAHASTIPLAMAGS